MEDKNSLINYKESIFKKIINWFKNIFKKSNKKEIIENDYIQQEQPQKETSICYEEKNYAEDIAPIDNNESNESEKEKFFSLYNNVKSKKIDIEDLSTEDLKKFNIMIREEVLLKQKKIDNINQENLKILEKINELDRKNNLIGESLSSN